MLHAAGCHNAPVDPRRLVLQHSEAPASPRAQAVLGHLCAAAADALPGAAGQVLAGAGRLPAVRAPAGRRLPVPALLLQLRRGPARRALSPGARRCRRCARAAARSMPRRRARAERTALPASLRNMLAALSAERWGQPGHSCTPCQRVCMQQAYQEHSALFCCAEGCPLVPAVRLAAGRRQCTPSSRGLRGVQGPWWSAQAWCTRRWPGGAWCGARPRWRRTRPRLRRRARARSRARPTAL